MSGFYLPRRQKITMKLKKPAKATRGRCGKYWKYAFPLFILATFSVYSVFSVLRPFEDDESLYILSGRAILDGSLNPFEVVYRGHYSNPFQYIMGSPLGPLVYGACYNLGGILLARAVSALFVIFSIALVYKMIARVKGSPAVPMALTALSAAAITIASDAFLDSIALFFLMASLYFGHGRGRMAFVSGIFSGLALATKFILAIPVAVIASHRMLGKGLPANDRLAYAAGCLMVALPFLFLYIDLIPVLANFLVVTKANFMPAESAEGFLRAFTSLGLPVASILAAYLLLSGKASPGPGRSSPHWPLLIPAVSVLAYQIISLDHVSLVRHLPYAEFPAAVVIGACIKDMRIGKGAALLLAAFAVLGISFAANSIANYPSYGLLEGHLQEVGGKVLALNLNSFMLAKGMPLNSTAENVYSYYYFNYDGVLDSKIEEYEAALKDGYFDYAIIASYKSGYPRYDMIEENVRKYYCKAFESGGPNGMAVYRRCGIGNGLKIRS